MTALSYMNLIMGMTGMYIGMRGMSNVRIGIRNPTNIGIRHNIEAQRRRAAWISSKGKVSRLEKQ